MIKKLVKNIVIYTAILYSILSMSYSAYVFTKNNKELANYLLDKNEYIDVRQGKNDDIFTILLYERIMSEKYLDLFFISLIIVSTVTSIIYFKKSNEARILLLYIIGNIIFTTTFFLIDYNLTNYYSNVMITDNSIYLENYKNFLISGIIPYTIIFVILVILKRIYKQIKNK